MQEPFRPIPQREQFAGSEIRKRQDLMPYFSGLFGEYQRNAPLIRLQPHPERVYAALEVTRKFRNAPLPEGEARQKNIEIVRRSFETEQPIPLEIVSGTSKTKDGSRTFDNHADLNELLMLLQIQHLHDGIMHVYKPGSHTTLLFEDATNEWLYGQVAPMELISRNNKSYSIGTGSCSTLFLIYICPINTLTESELLGQAGIEKTKLFDSLRQSTGCICCIYYRVTATYRPGRAIFRV